MLFLAHTLAYNVIDCMHDCLRAMGPQAPTVAKFVPFLKVGAAPKGFMGRNTKMLETD